MKRLLLLLLVLVMSSTCCFAEGNPSLRQENDADLDAGIYDSYFDDAVFVGDSVTRQFSTYIREQREALGFPVLGEARFLCAINYGLYRGSRKYLQKGDPQLRYRATNVTVHGGLKWMEAGKAFIMLGLNDRVGGKKIEKEVGWYTQLIDNVLEHNPDILFVAESLTPIVRGAEDKTLRREYLTAFNQRIEALCAEKGVSYLDITTPLLDEDGFMKPEYAYDRLCHMNNDGLYIWLTELRRFARDQYEKGLWTMETEVTEE